MIALAACANFSGMRPKTHYTRCGDVDVAYQVVGDGPLDLVIVPGWISHLDLNWEMFGFESWIRRLSSFARVILFDKRGCGLSERDVGNSTIEERMDDLRAVLDAVGSESAACVGFSEGGPLAILYAASYPDRVRALVLLGTFPATVVDDDLPMAAEGRVVLEEMHRLAQTHWGEGRTLRRVSPSLADHPTAIEFMGRLERAAMSPRAAAAHIEWILEIDVRPVARALRIPTLVLHRRGDALVTVGGGRWLGANVPQARYVEFDGNDHAPWMGDATPILDEIERFLTGSLAGDVSDRVLTTVLFTDIVGSTERAVQLGDRRWRELLARHHSIVRDQIRRHRGIEQDTTGDGFFASFDGPARAIRCAIDTREALRPLDVDIRAGVHTGECARLDGKLAGIAVHMGARVMAEAGPGEVIVSGTVKDLVAGSGLAFADRGTRVLKGIPGEWRLFAVAQ